MRRRPDRRTMIGTSRRKEATVPDEPFDEATEPVAVPDELFDEATGPVAVPRGPVGDT